MFKNKLILCLVSEIIFLGFLEQVGVYVLVVKSK